MICGTCWSLCMFLRLSDKTENRANSIMVDTLVQQGVLTPCTRSGLDPTASPFSVPKNSEKASLICSLVLFNEAVGAKPPRTQLPSVELVELLMLVDRVGEATIFAPRTKSWDDPPLQAMRAFAWLKCPW